jgi:hypothetical protein
MYPVRASWLRWGVTATLALMLCALFVTPTLAGGSPSVNLIPTQEVVSGTTTFGAFGPVGPDCDATSGGPGCTFATAITTGSGVAVPGGPFTHTTNATVYYGPSFSSVFPNGAVDPATGSPVGFCAEISGTVHTVLANGTIDANAQGYTCCSNSCSNGLGPPTTTFVTTACTSGTGQYAGIQCSGKESSSSSDGVHYVARGEAVMTK